MSDFAFLHHWPYRARTGGIAVGMPTGIRLALYVVLILCLVNLPAARAEPAAPDTMAARTQACTVCHGAQGKAGPDGYYPRLAGKPAGYLYNQLLNFQQGRRHYAPMQRLLETLDHRNLWQIATYFSAQNLPWPPAKKSTQSPALASRMQTLVEQGDRARGLPACSQCHGTALGGTQPAVPGLLGLPADYIVAQLGAWKTGQRHAQAPDCMAKVARLLGAGETGAMAQWLSAQPVSGHAAPASQRPAARAGAIDVSAPEWRCGTTPAPVADSVSPATLARGAYIARIGNCQHCHTAPGGAAWAGGRAIDTPFGAVMSPNISPDKNRGIGNWTAQDFWQALHHGIGKDGRALYPAFPYTSYRWVSREDADALFAWLQTVPAANTPNRPHTLRWPYSTQAALKAWRLLFFNGGDTASPLAAQEGTTPEQTELARGAYLVNGLGHCSECHAARNALGAMTDAKPGEGFVLPVSQWYAPPLRGRDLATWSTAQWQTFLQTGVSPWGFAAGPMAGVVFHSTQYLSETDARAMAAYLKNRAADPVGDTRTGAAAVRQGSSTGSTYRPEQGAAIYRQHCADCHGKTGQGQPGTYPALAGNPHVVQDNTNNLVLQLMYGGYPAATPGNPEPRGMPPYMLSLSNAEMAAVLSHIRNNWGNRASVVREFDINRLRNALPP